MNLCRFLRRICYDSTTRVEFAGMTRGQFFMARGVRQGCPASGFLFAMAFDPIFRWLQDAIIPRNPAGLDFLQLTQCAYADDLAVAAPSFRGFLTASAPACQTVDQIAGLQYGSERRESLSNWLSENCEGLLRNAGCRVCQVRGHHDWTGWPHSPLDGTSENHSTCPENQRLYQKPGRATVRPKDLCVVRIWLHRIHIQSYSQS